jgi:Fe-S-cluster containining protein
MTMNRPSVAKAKEITNGTAVFQLVESTEMPSVIDSEKIVVGPVSLFGVQKHVSILCSDPFARLSELVPLARSVCDYAVYEARNRATTQGKTVPCCNKCSSCCSYLVPLSIPEVIHLYEEIQSLSSEQGQEFWRNSLSVAGQLLDNETADVPNEASTLDQVGQWYASKQASCPLLEDDLCALYDQRPLACREYLVATPSSWCRPESVGCVEKIELPFSVLESLGRVAAQLEGTPVEAVMLPLILPWIQENDERIHRKWSSKEMAQCFLNSLA